ncbi:class I SAM-dependent methyltransferase [candidate division CSSED10-310 bacterium]|uniref:Class I SAM-dependent methyltransferase n=1 Tax=candidate division CSSED10-310 bacterium TaxID=2855610 RepID=A0ABV6Z4Q4_UNCC1
MAVTPEVGGHSVLGVDISADFVELARKRLSYDPLPPFVEVDFDVNFMVHDIELGPLESELLYDVAILEATLHHFYDPVSALKNIGHNLAPDGIIAIIEGGAPEEGSALFRRHHEIMHRYHTLERPFTRKQLMKLLTLAGFSCFQFMFPLNGLFEQTLESVASLKSNISFDWNIVLASRTPDALARIVSQPLRKHTYSNCVSFDRGFFPEETKEDGTVFCWSGVQSTLKLDQVKHLKIVLSSSVPLRIQKKQTIYVYRNNELCGRYQLSKRKNQVMLDLPSLETCREIQFISDVCFSPQWFGSLDTRVLSFMLEIIECQTMPENHGGC